MTEEEWGGNSAKASLVLVTYLRYVRDQTFYTRNNSMNQLCKMFCFFALASPAAVLPLQAASYTWVGGDTGTPHAFGDPANWGATTLAAGDNLQISTTDASLYPIISTGTLGQYPFAVGNLTVGSGSTDGKLEEDSGVLTVNGDTNIGSTTTAGSTFVMTGGTFTQSGGSTMLIGCNGTTGSLTLGGGAALNFDHGGSNIWVGAAPGNSLSSKGSLTVSGGATLTTASNLWIGAAQQGSLTMQDGHISAGGWFNIGSNGYGGGGNAGNGIATIDGASTIVMTGGGNMAIGVNDNGTSGAYGNVTIQGTSSLTCNNGSTIYVGYSGTGSAPSTLALHGSGTVTLNSTSALIVGNGTAGTMTMDGSSIFTQTSGGTIIGNGDGSNGTLTIAGSAQFLENQPRATGRLVIGTPCDVGNPAVATLTLGTLGGSDNPTFTVAGASAAVIGDANSHVTVNINSGTFNGNSLNSGGYVGMGYGAAVVVWNQNGGLTNFPSGSSPFIGTGNGDNVTLNFNGGVFATPYIKTDTPNFTATVNINFNGGTLKANGSDPSSTFPFINVRSNGTFNGTVQAGGAIWDTNGFTNTMQYPLVHDASLGTALDGGLTKLSAGTLVLSAVNTYTGPTAVNAGELVLTNSNATSAVAVQSGAKLTLSYGNPFTPPTVPCEISVATGGTLSSVNAGSPISAYANATFANKSNLSVPDTSGYFSTLAIQNLSSVNNGDKVVVDVPGLNTGDSGAVLTYVTRGPNVPTFITKVDGVGRNELAINDDGVSTVTVSSSYNSTDGWVGRASPADNGWYGAGGNSTWQGTVPNGTGARAYFDDAYAPPTDGYTCLLNGDATVSSLVFNAASGGYTIASDGTHAITLKTTIAVDTRIEVLGGAHTINPNIKMAAGDPTITVASGASLIINGVMSDLVAGSPAGVTIAGAGTLTLNGANTYTGPTVLQNGTLQVGNASALGAATAAFTVAGGTIADAGANVTLNKGFTLTRNATIAPVNSLTFAGTVSYVGGTVTKLGTGTAGFNTPAVTTNTVGAINAEAGTLAFDGNASSIYNVARLNVGGMGGLGNESSDPYDGAVATMTVNNVGIAGTVGAVVGGYWSGASTPGTQPTGTLTLSGSATMNETGVLCLGYWGGHGTVNVGGSSTLTATNSMQIGYNWGDNSATQVGSGEVNVNDSGHVVVNAIYLGYVGGIGVWNQNGGLTETTATVQLGQSDSGQGANATGSGTLNLNGGTFQAPGIITGSTTSGHAAATLATVNFSGGTLKATGDNSNFIANTTGATLTLNVLKNVTSGLGAVIDTNGHSITISQPLVTGVVGGTDGGLTKLGPGTLVTSAPNTYTGPTVVNNGALQLKTTPIVMHQTTSTAANAAGNRGGPGDGPYNLGMRFYVNTPIQVTQLGVFDDLGDGLAIPHVVHISYSTTGVDVASLTVDTGSTVGTYQNGYRFLNLGSAVTLPAGNNFTVWVENMGAGVDKFGQNMSTYDSGSGAITPNLTVFQTNLYAMPDQNWGVNSESSATFMYYNPSSVVIANLLPITTPVVLGGATGSTPTLDLQGANQQIASLADVAAPPYSAL